MSLKLSPLVAMLLPVALVAGVLLSADAQQEKTRQKPEQKKTQQNATSQQPSDEAVERTRKTVRMLDDVYKSVIVLITDKYVNSESDYPAGSAAIDLFGEIEKKGWHSVRLIDVTGQPYDPENVAQDAFEHEGIRKLKAGESYHEEVVRKHGKTYLRAMTPVPVVMQKCVMCHPHYEDVEMGKPIGAVSYMLPIE